MTAHGAERRRWNMRLRPRESFRLIVQLVGRHSHRLRCRKCVRVAPSSALGVLITVPNAGRPDVHPVRLRLSTVNYVVVPNVVTVMTSVPIVGR